MTPLKSLIRAAIEADGPMPLDRYMALCLGHPAHGYYATRDPFGAAGDFVTAPEISQMFGELIGLWVAEVWRMMGSPSRVALIELGPGRGTLMADMLRAGRAAPGFLDAAEVTLVETSPTLREAQAKTLAASARAIRFAATIDEAFREAALPVLVVANEFFDALPVRQFVRAASGWRERLVGLGESGALAFGLSPEPPAGLSLPHAPEGPVREVSAASLDIAARIAADLTAHGGAMLAIDYGYGAGHGDTLQAMKAHRFVDPLAEPGEADLTAHVDFASLAAAAAREGAAVMRLLTQADLLDRLGLAQRAEALARAAPHKRAEIEAQAARLCDRTPRGMGALFKALAFADPRLGALPGFEPAARAGA